MLGITQLCGFGVGDSNILRVGYAQGTGSSTTNITINKPTGTITNDLMIAMVSNDQTGGNDMWTGDTDWTEVADGNIGSNLRLAYKVAGASEGASYTFVCDSSRTSLAGCIITFRNCTYDVVGSYSPIANPTVAPEIAVTLNDSVLLAFYSSKGKTFGDVSGMTEICKQEVVDAVYRVFQQSINAGATGSRTSDTVEERGNVGILVSIKPL